MDKHPWELRQPMPTTAQSRDSLVSQIARMWPEEGESGKAEGGIRGVSEEPHRVVVSKSAAEG